MATMIVRSGAVLKSSLWLCGTNLTNDVLRKVSVPHLNIRKIVPSSLTIEATFGFQGSHGRRRVALQATPDVQTSVRSVPVQVAKELLEAGHFYLDVRTAEEFASGHVAGAVNVPYMFKQSTGMTKNQHFLEDVAAAFDKGDELVVGCQSGKRSLAAVTELQAADYACVTDVSGGFHAWKESGLHVHHP